jgi:hypothetical protein
VFEIVTGVLFKIAFRWKIHYNFFYISKSKQLENTKKINLMFFQGKNIFEKQLKTKSN